MGQLTASIAHEVNQPLAALLANAEACQLWLDRDIPNLDAARHSLEWIIKDGNRAAALYRRLGFESIGRVGNSDTMVLELHS